VIALVAVLAAACEFPGQRPSAAPTVAATRSPSTATPATATAAPTTSQATPTAVPIPLELRHEIEDAYERYWQVHADAALTLDPSHLPEVLAGDKLENERQLVAQLRAEGRAAKVIVGLDYRVVRATETSATVYDDYKNYSYLVDPNTKAPLVDPPAVPEIHVVSFELQKIDGMWKVVDGARYETRRPS
jgi:hypothetical protein